MEKITPEASGELERLQAELDAILRHDKEAVQQLNAAEAELKSLTESRTFWRKFAAKLEAERDALKATIEQARALHIAEPGQHPDFCWHDKHELPCPTLVALDALPGITSPDGEVMGAPPAPGPKATPPAP